MSPQNNRHTWQSWRDHYLRTLTKQDQEPAMLNAPPTPPSDHLETNSGLPREPHQQVEEKEGHFSKEDMECLLDLGEHIVNILPENTEAAWEKWADEQDVSTDR